MGASSVLFFKNKFLNPTSTASPMIGDLRLLLMDKPLLKVEFASLKSSLYKTKACDHIDCDNSIVLGFYSG
jgi:hypothetical protein